MATRTRPRRQGAATAKTPEPGTGTLHAEWTGAPWTGHFKKSWNVRETSKPAGMAGFAYFLGVIGSATYYIQAADSFGTGLLGFLKALVWPAFLVYETLLRLGA